MRTYFSEEYFTFNNTMPVNFFYKLPNKVRNKYEQLYVNFVEYSDFLWINRNKQHVDKYMKNIKPDIYNLILDTEPKGTLLLFIEYYKLLYPVIRDIVQEYDLYDQYPEYCF